MMAKLFISFCATILFHVGLTQQNNNTIVINPVKQNEEELMKKIYQYPQFTAGKAVYMDGNITHSMLNYNYLTNQIIFIAPKGDTLELIHGDDFSKIVINTDTFYYHDKKFIQQITHYPSYNLLLKHSLENRGSEKKGAYDTYSSTTAISPINLIVDNRVGTIKLATDENIVFVFRDYYYLTGKFGSFYPATKKGAMDLFAKNQKQLKQFLEKNDINFGKKEDLEKLLEYAHTTLK